MKPEEKVESVKEVLTVQEITEAQIRNDGREYNASEWDKKIDRMMKFKNCKFYVAPPQRGYAYERYFATYEIEGGIILFNNVSYHSMLSNSGFCRITIAPDGIVRRFLLKDVNGNEGYCANDKANRRILAQNSQKFGAIFTNNF